MVPESVLPPITGVAVVGAKFSDFSSMDLWRDYRNYPGWTLDAFIKRFPSHRDHSLTVSEAERRRADLEQRRGAKGNQPDAGTTHLPDEGIQLG